MEQKILLYTKEGCPYAARLVEELKGKGADFVEINLTFDREALEEIKAKYGADRVPVLVEGDKVTVGYHGGLG